MHVSPKPSLARSSSCSTASCIRRSPLSPQVRAAGGADRVVLPRFRPAGGAENNPGCPRRTVHALQAVHVVHRVDHPPAASAAPVELPPALAFPCRRQRVLRSFAAIYLRGASQCAGCIAVKAEASAARVLDDLILRRRPALHLCRVPPFFRFSGGKKIRFPPLLLLLYSRLCAIMGIGYRRKSRSALAPAGGSTRTLYLFLRICPHTF